MNHDYLQLALAGVGLRVLAADARRLIRRLLGAGVRVGAAYMAQEQHDQKAQDTVLLAWPTSRREDA